MLNLSVYYGITLIHEQQDVIHEWIKTNNLDTYREPFFKDADQLIALGVKLSVSPLPGIYSGWACNQNWDTIGKEKMEKWLSTQSEDDVAANMLKTQINTCQVMLLAENI